MIVGEGPVLRACTRCGLAGDQSFEFASQHVTSLGVIVYARCAYGLLRAFLRDKAMGQVTKDTYGRPPQGLSPPRTQPMAFSHQHHWSFASRVR
jgi:hypothetical protein